MERSAGCRPQGEGVKLFLKAPAKINWFLSVEGKRTDGYHDIVSVVQCVDVYDSLTCEDAERIEVVSDLDVPVEDNLVYRAAMSMQRFSPQARGARITLDKQIPVAAGLGGGSSDAAYTIMGLNELWSLGLERRDLIEIGAGVGCDVPFFISGYFSLMEGRGERVRPLRGGRAVTLLLVKPDIAVSTAWAYRQLDGRKLTKERIDIKLFCQSLDREDYAALRPMVFNDLEGPVLGKYGAVAGIKEKLYDNGAVIACMSGSGPTVFGVFASHEQACAASDVMGMHWRRVVRTLIESGNRREESEL
jgi:4-diphosphocytidyl-2-C-methyl-D-erythritol kinase